MEKPIYTDGFVAFLGAVSLASTMWMVLTSEALVWFEIAVYVVLCIIFLTLIAAFAYTRWFKNEKPHVD